MIINRDILEALKRLAKGGEGSGNFGHEGRPGEVGGSGGGGGTSGGEKPSGGDGGGGGTYHEKPSLTGRRIGSGDTPSYGDEYSDRNTEQFENVGKETLLGNKNYLLRTESQRKDADGKFHYNIVEDYAKRGESDFGRLVSKWNADTGGDWEAEKIEARLKRKFD